MFAAATPASPTAPVRPKHDYGNISLSFEANRGQAGPGVKFLSRGDGYALFLTDTGAIFAQSKGVLCDSANTGDRPAGSGKDATCGSGQTPQSVVRMTLVDAAGKPVSRLPQVNGEEKLPGQVNYFLGSDPAKWHTGLPTYGKVRYAAVYPGVDLVYYGNQRQLEYDFVVAPGGNPASIHLNFGDALHPRITAEGDLVLQGSEGASDRMILRKPVLYQETGGRRQSIAGSFRAAIDGTVSFAVGTYDHSRPLVIDPVLIYSTYLGGSGTSGNGDQGNGIVVDSAGNAYIVGTTYSSDFPVTHKAFQSKNSAIPAPGNVVFVSKLNAAGTALVYSTYLGGSGGDFGYGIGIDAAGNAYVTGATYSQDFPVTCDAILTTNPTKTPKAAVGFVASLSTTGGTLRYSTYLGGSGANDGVDRQPTGHGDIAQAIAVSANGDAFVTGYTYSSDFPVTSGAFQPTFNGNGGYANVFVSRLNRFGTALTYSTYLGGSDSLYPGDFGNAVAVDSSGDAFVTGQTFSANFPVTGGAAQTVYSASGGGEAFLTELSPDGTAEVYSTYIGGNSGQAVAVVSQGYAYVAGLTASNDFPTTAGVLQGADFGASAFAPETYPFYAQPGPPSGFVTKVNTDGTSFVYSTYLESSLTSVTGLAVDSSGAAYVTGGTGKFGLDMWSGFKTTPDALSVPDAGGNEAFLVKLDPTAAFLNYATLIGGEVSDGATAVTLDHDGNVYLTGYTGSATFPVTTGAYQALNKTTVKNGTNAFVAKLSLQSELNQTTYPPYPSNVPTSLTILYQDFQWGVCDFLWGEQINLSLNTPIPGPAPTGEIFINNDGGGLTTEYDFYGTVWGGFNEADIFNDPGISAFPQWTATYSGDAVYQSSTVSGDPSVPGCDPSQDNARRNSLTSLTYPGTSLHAGNHPAKISLKMNQSAAAKARVASIQANLRGPKFSPPPPALSSVQFKQADTPAPTCIAPAPKPVLTVRAISYSKVYGAPNPTFTYATTGLVAGDDITVQFSTTVTTASPVGTYSIHPIVTGSSLDNYSAVNLIDGVFYVRPRPLSISANSQNVVYGQTPSAITGFSLQGFVNGDTLAVVSGAPVLSTPVTSTTPVGYYPIHIGVGTLTAANYTFVPFAQPGVVHVLKAHLIAKADNKSMPRGGPLPAFTYTLTGFVNSDNPGNSVTGAPILSTSAGVNSRPGTFPIYLNTGSLSSPNYSITSATGTLTITP